MLKAKLPQSFCCFLRCLARHDLPLLRGELGGSALPGGRRSPLLEVSRVHETITQGQPAPAAFQAAFEVSPAQFSATLHHYVNGSIPRVSTHLPHIDASVVRISRPPPAYDDLLLLVARMEHNVDNSSLATEVEAIAARFPDDAFAQCARARAMLARNAPSEARSALATVLALAPDNIEANYLMGQSYLREAGSTPDSDTNTATQSRRYFTRAFRGDSAFVPNLFAYAQSYEISGTPMSDNALNVLLRAYDLAPQIDDIAVYAAFQLMLHQRFDEATAILRPIAHAPHGGSGARYAQHLLERAVAHQEPDSYTDEGDDAPSQATPPQSPPAPRPR